MDKFKVFSFNLTKLETQNEVDIRLSKEINKFIEDNPHFEFLGIDRVKHLYVVHYRVPESTK